MKPWMMFGFVLLATSCGSSSGQPEVVDQESAGIIPVAMFTNGTSGFQYLINPSFISAQPQDVCTIDSFDPCKIVTCPQARAGDPFASAGTLTLSVGSTSIPLDAQPSGYTNVERQGVLFNGGETISFQAAGDTVPPFSGSVTAPGPITVTAPVSGQMLMISQSQPLQLSWTGKSAGDVVLILTTQDLTTTVECELSASQQSATIPVTALGHIAQGSYTGDIVTRTRNEVGAGGWSVLLEAEYHAGVPTGAYVRPAVVGP